MIMVCCLALPRDCTGGKCTCDPTYKLPQYHITGLDGGAHDVNAVFNWQGVWHVMHQRNGGWGHLVSTDFVKWSRLPNAIDGGSWDGSLTILDGKPVILFDCTSIQNCLPKRVESESDIIGVGDPPIIGVAWPVNNSDPNLTSWVKDSHNPAYFDGSPAKYSGPSNVWKNGNKYQMEMILGGATALYESTDPQLHNWSIVNPTFYPKRGGGGGIFFPLPKCVSGTANYTHMMQEDFYGDGTPWFVLGTFDFPTSKFTPGMSPIPLDVSSDMRYTEVWVGGGRMIHMGWVAGNKCLSIPRQVTYDAKLVQLLSVPVDEISALRGEVLGSHRATTIAAGDSLSVFSTGKTSLTFDIEVDIALPSKAPVSVKISAMATGPDPAKNQTQYLLLLNITTPDASTGLREVTAVHCALPSCQWDGARDRYRFMLPDTEKSLLVRLLGDRTIIETFIASGRAVMTSKVPVDVNIASAFVLSSSQSAVTVNKVSAWNMGCGWA